MRLRIANKTDMLFMGGVFALLIAVAHECLSYPPISDSWEMFFSFHHLDAYPGRFKWLHILNLDPFEKMRYQPLSYCFYYAFHLIFGSDFVYFKAANVLCYFVSIVLVYKFACRFCSRRSVAAVVIGFYAFLFSHFDIVLWSSHIYVVFGLCSIVGAFLLFAAFMESGRRVFVVPVPFLLIVGLLCYETFVLWPLGLLFLVGMERFMTHRSLERRRILRTCLGVLAVVYVFYILFFFYTRWLGTYPEPERTVLDFLRIENMVSSVFLVFFNLIYNNIILNIWPFLAFPLFIRGNIYMGGAVIGWIKSGGREIVFAGGAASIFIFIAVCALMLRAERREELKVIGFLMFMYLSALYVVIFCRFSSNDFAYCLTEFRYQYSPGAFFFVLAAFGADRFVGRSRRRLVVLVCTLGALMSLNLLCIDRVVGIYNRQFAPVTHMITQIKRGIDDGTINKEEKIYMDERLPDYLPNLCWNIEMGVRFIQGNYQWMFAGDEIDFFTINPQKAKWEIDPRTFNVVPIGSRHGSKREFVLNFEEDCDWYINRPKHEEYFDLAGNFYAKGESSLAFLMYMRVLELNPRYRPAVKEIEALKNSKECHIDCVEGRIDPATIAPTG